mmetsp:Transcript_137774/g.343886  ORF Transcript_137774/g.343886 Transcript_137774/m.343886 type:complete len:158 (+) Transcript_137774:46-519(+)
MVLGQRPFRAMVGRTAAVVVALIVPLVAGCSTPPASYCGPAAGFHLNIKECAHIFGFPAGAAKCNISATTKTSGFACLLPRGNDVELCFGTSCHSSDGDSSPDIIGWMKPAKEQVLQVSNMHHTTCEVEVTDFKYCCEEISTASNEGPKLADNELVI